MFSFVIFCSSILKKLAVSKITLSSSTIFDILPPPIYLVIGDYAWGFREHVILGTTFGFSIRDPSLKSSVHKSYFLNVKEIRRQFRIGVTTPQTQGSAFAWSLFSRSSHGTTLY